MTQEEIRELSLTPTRRREKQSTDLRHAEENLSELTSAPLPLNVETKRRPHRRVLEGRSSVRHRPPWAWRAFLPVSRERHHRAGWLFQENSFTWKHPLSQRSLLNQKQETTRGQGQKPTQTKARPQMNSYHNCLALFPSHEQLRVHCAVLSEILRHRQGQRQDSVRLDTRSSHNETVSYCAFALRCSFTTSNNKRVLHATVGRMEELR